MTLHVIREREKADSRRRVQPYYVADDTLADVTETTAINEATSACTTYHGSPPNSVSTEEITNHAWRVHCIYSASQATPLPQTPWPGLGEFRYRFSFAAKTRFAKLSLSRNRVYPNTEPDHGNLINVEGNKALGAAIQVPPPTFIYEYTLPYALVTTTYQRNVAKLCGTVANHPWLGYFANELLLVQCNGSWTHSDRWTISFGYAFDPTRYNATFDTIVVPSIPGHRFVWPTTKTEVNNIGTAAEVTKAIYVSQVWAEANHYPLFL